MSDTNSPFFDTVRVHFPIQFWSSLCEKDLQESVKENDKLLMVTDVHIPYSSRHKTENSQKY